MSLGWSGKRFTIGFLEEAAEEAGVRLYVHFHSRHPVGSILDRGVARRSFGLLRHDLLLQIDPSASDPRAGYVLRPGPLITSFLAVRLRRRTLAALAPVVSHTPFSRSPCY